MYALRMFILCAIFHTMWSGKSLQLQCILPFGMLCFSPISMIVRVVVHDVRLYSVLDTVVIYGDDVRCSVVFGTLVGVLVLCGPSY